MSLPYLLASLPHLMFEGASEPMKAEDFVAACKEQLSEADAKVAEMLVKNDMPTSRQTDKPAGRHVGASSCRNSFANAWLKKEALIRNAVARCRKGGADIPVCQLRADRQTGMSAPPSDYQIDKAVESAFELKNPAERDAALERLKWEIVEKLVGFDPMSRDAVFGYAIKLKICLRRAAMTREAGLKISQKILEAPLPDVVEVADE